VPGETEELKARSRAEVTNIRLLETADTPSLPGGRTPKATAGGLKYQRAGIMLAFPLANVGANLPALLATVCGNLYELAEHTGCKLLDLELPPAFGDKYPGPQFGVGGTRRLAGVFDRPIIGTIVKPSVGLSPEQTAETVCELAEAGIDFVKDDELQADAHEVVPRLKPGTLVITLDPAVTHPGGLPLRPDVSYFVTHPCHPSVFEHFETVAERDDFFGGIPARQAIVCALMQGPEAHYALGEGLARQFFGPVTRSHRLTVEQLAILETDQGRGVRHRAGAGPARSARGSGAPGRATRGRRGFHVRPRQGRTRHRLWPGRIPVFRRRQADRGIRQTTALPRRLAEAVRAGQREGAGEHVSGREVAGARAILILPCVWKSGNSDAG
jgi:hypothetical protein